MKRKQLLLLLALLMTAATGAWGKQIYISYPAWPTGTSSVSAGNLVLEMELSDSFENLKAKIEDKSGLNPTYMHLFFNDAECPNDETLAQKGVTEGSVLTLEYTPPYAVKLADGTKDAAKWTATVGTNSNAQTLPVGGLSKGNAVTLTYTGRLKVKSVTATTDAKPAEATPALSINSPSVGQVIGSDGKNYDYGSLPTGVTAVAKICYVSGSKGLALALTDEGGAMNWRPAIETIAAHTAPFTGGTWKVASKDEWSNMITAAGSYTALRDGFTSVGGTNMQSDYYWTSTEWDSNGAWSYDFSNGYWASDPMDFDSYVRACLAFTVEQGGATYTLLSAATTSDYGKVVCAAGHLHDAKTAVPTGCTAVGILGKVTETGNGLILALQNATEQEWETINGWTSVTTYAGTTLKVLPDDDARGSLTSYTKLGETAVSNWAVAQKSDYEAIFENLGSTQSDGFNGTTYDDNVNDFITTGVGGLAILGFYWSATEDSDFNQSWNFYNYCWTLNGKSTSYNVRPVLGF